MAAPPTQYTPARSCAPIPAASIASRVACAARTSTGRPRASSRALCSTTAGRGAGSAAATAAAVCVKVSFAVRALANSTTRSPSDSGAAAAPSPSSGRWPPSMTSSSARTSSIPAPPASGASMVDSTSNPVGARRNTEASNPPPKSHTSTYAPTRTVVPPATIRWAAATGASTKLGWPNPARCAARRTSVRRRGPHPAGTTSRTSATGRSATRVASAATRRRIAATRSTASTSPSPTPMRPSPSRRNGAGTKRSGHPAACCHAAAPVTTPPP